MWEWSHTQEAYDYAREQLEGKSKSDLLDIVSKWNHFYKEKDRKDLCLKYSQELPAWSLASWIWEQASSWEYGRSCSNGGHELYLDPYGTHTVDLGEMPKDWQPSDY